MQKHCKDCKWSLMDVRWGEYKCKYLERYVKDPAEAEDCTHFRPKPVKGKKEEILRRRL